MLPTVEASATGGVATAMVAKEVRAAAAAMVAATEEVAVVEAAHQEALIKDQSAKCVSNGGTRQQIVGIGTTRITFLTPSMLQLQRLTPMELDTNWYIDTGATDHVTGELDKLTMKEKYNGGEQIHTASGAGMDISHIGHAIVHNPNSRNIHLRNVLYVPQAKKNLVSVHRLVNDNSAFLELHRDYFFLKDQITRRTLLKGRSWRRLYPLPTVLYEASLQRRQVVVRSVA